MTVLTSQQPDMETSPMPVSHPLPAVAASVTRPGC
jgi:hypothetical protein